MSTTDVTPRDWSSRPCLDGSYPLDTRSLSDVTQRISEPEGDLTVGSLTGLDQQESHLPLTQVESEDQSPGGRR